MPVKTVHCSKCGKAISGYDFPARMAKTRRHYAKHHPAAFKKSIKKGVRTRASEKGKNNGIKKDNNGSA